METFISFLLLPAQKESYTIENRLPASVSWADTYSNNLILLSNWTNKCASKTLGGMTFYNAHRQVTVQQTILLKSESLCSKTVLAKHQTLHNLLGMKRS